MQALAAGLGYARRSFVQQKNVVAIFVTVILSAVAYGWIEGTLYPYYPLKNELAIWGHFTWYHAVFMSLFIIIGFSLSVGRVLISGLRNYYLVFASAGSVIWGFWVEDMSYFSTTYPTEMLQPGVWVEWTLSGFYFVGHWIPTVYVLLCAGGFLLYGFAFLVARRDPTAFKTRSSKSSAQHVVELVRSHWLALVASALAAESANLIAASLTNVTVPMTVQVRLGLVLLVVLAVPLFLLLILDRVSV